MLGFIRSWIVVLGKTLTYLYPPSLNRKIRLVRQMIYSAWLSREFKDFGKGILIGRSLHLLGGKYISIGRGASIGKMGVLTAWDKYGEQRFSPAITIGEGANIGDYVHISAISRISIGANVLTGRWVTIVDNAHGQATLADLQIPPILRPLHSKGSIVIEDNVWIGDKATILAGVTIGKNAIVGANSVVIRDVPANAIVAGIPAIIIKQIL